MLFRYPGGKKKIARQITKIIAGHLEQTAHANYEYREPFFGSGAIGFEVLNRIKLRRAWFNDRDPAICCVWHQVRNPERLKAMLAEFVPSVASFFEFKGDLLAVTGITDVTDGLLVAMKKIAIQQMSYSGLGTMAGGPIGGLKQQSDYSVGCRYSLPTLFRSIDTAADLLRRTETHPDVCSNLDFQKVIQAPGNAVMYLDPPYFEKGPDLYQFSFTVDDHARLASVLREEERPWLLSYDRHPAIEELYGGWAELGEVVLTYSINGANSKSEYLIANEPLSDAVRRICSEVLVTT